MSVMVRKPTIVEETRISRGERRARVHVPIVELIHKAKYTVMAWPVT